MKLGNNEYKPISFWSWNSDMQEEEVRWQVREFKDKGFGGFFIHSRGGRLIPYMGEEWFRACETALDEAAKQGIDAWLYDEDGWPSGFAGGLVNGCGEEYWAKRLYFDTGYPDKDNLRLLAVYRKNEEGSYERIEIEEATEGDLHCFCQLIPNYVDIMNRKVTEKFIEVTHEEYKKHFGQYFGTVVKGIFMDEAHTVGRACWSESLRERYQEKYGEDLIDNLWLMQVDGKGYQSFRYRFWNCVNELVKENFAEQLNDWCNANNLILTGHYSAEDGLCEQVGGGGGVMPFYHYMGMPGIDHLGNRYASPVLMKQVTSVAHRRGVPYVLSESFGCAGWDVTFKDLLGIAGWQAAMGVNTICTHLSAFSMVGRRKRDFPAFFSYQTNWWEDTAVLFEAIRKLNSIISGSHRVTKVAVLHPIRSVWLESCARNDLFARCLAANFRDLVEHLLDIQVDFDLIDESELETATIENHAIKSGEVSYSLLIVPQLTTLGSATVNKIDEFSKNEGKILFMNAKPRSVEGDTTHPLVNTIRKVRATVLQNTRNMLQKYFRRFPVQDNYRLLDLRLEKDISGIISHYGTTSNGAVLYLFNHSTGHSISMNLRHKGRCKVEVISLTDDGREELPCRYQGDYTYAPVTVESKEGVLIQITYVEEVECSCQMQIAKTELLSIETVKPLAENSLTVDYGRYRINDGEFSEYKAIVHMLDEIYDRIAKNEGDSKVCVEYTFDADFSKIPNNLTLAVEKVEQLEIYLNSKPVTKEMGWWIDKGIIRYDISELVVNGKNTVCLNYVFPSTKQVNNLNGKYETERNRFFFKIEPESIYISGDFDVRCNNEVADNVTFYSIKNTLKHSPTFTLVDATQKNAQDITAQGMWFYCGDCEFSGQVDYDGIGELYANIENMHCINAKIYVNGKYTGMQILTGDKVCLTPYLNKGINKITVVATGHNRNLMGPHHHIRGELYMVGPRTYAGVKEMEDFVNPEVVERCTWTDHYSFAPFGINRIMIQTMK